LTNLGIVQSDSNSLNENNGTQKRNLMLNTDPEDQYALFYVNNNWYLFFRLHHILCERLGRMYDRAMILAAEEAKEKVDRKQSTAVALRLKPNSKSFSYE
jgi:paired amphipathic helix protein Sin3a